MEDEGISLHELRGDMSASASPQGRRPELLHPIDGEAYNFIMGWRLELIALALLLLTFVTTFEMIIVNTAILPIGNALNEFSQSSWTVTAYLVAYIGKNLSQISRHIILHLLTNT
ncbi:hypothetical protein BDV29DRAFT_159162 [Aspergillus leporis]|uniref:Major facilitator superfamily (MFS) profile domain-containing protein n=1 Tax=Aspergillus leporis TaxID=41062 RepID=A0A5N5WWZ5_9EURO|nr:hypothetical protein BDV29DRAFT_159162 [Aspergillus leporis]